MTGPVLELVGRTPLVALARIAGDAPLLARCEHLNPAAARVGLSVQALKSRLLRARGELRAAVAASVRA